MAEYAGETLETLMEEIQNGLCAYCEFSTTEISGDYLTPMIIHMRENHARVLPPEFARLRVERRLGS